jgi:Asp-tRNA(Asn)/Glu-tRNA(Gln) amidotransferase A subunit family amidase
LAARAAALRSGKLDLMRYLGEVCDRIEALEPTVQALVPTADRRARLLREAAELERQHPNPEKRPLLYGVPLGVKDIFHARGFVTRAGTQLPSELFAGAEASCVATLRAAGALVLGKTATTEFAYAEPGPTRNPHNPAHTPGGSSSGSAAAVAAGFCSLAIGTQTVGSTIRPAAFCGIIGFKPSFGRIPTAGAVTFASSADHVGLFTQDVAGMGLAASILCRDWWALHEPPGEARRDSRRALPTLGVPDGPYLQQASSAALEAFDTQLESLRSAGYPVRHVQMLDDIGEINRRHWRMCAAELAQAHALWFAQYEDLYRPRTAALIRDGQSVGADELAAARAGRIELRTKLERQMGAEEIDLWVCPAATGPAPEGLDYTGDPCMNLPWTYVGLPAVTLPAGRAANGLPLGLQCVAKFMNDERLLLCAKQLERMLNFHASSRA